MAGGLAAVARRPVPEAPPGGMQSSDLQGLWLILPPDELQTLIKEEFY